MLMADAYSGHHLCRVHSWVLAIAVQMLLTEAAPTNTTRSDSTITHLVIVLVGAVSMFVAVMAFKTAYRYINRMSDGGKTHNQFDEDFSFRGHMSHQKNAAPTAKQAAVLATGPCDDAESACPEVAIDILPDAGKLKDSQVHEGALVRTAPAEGALARAALVAPELSSASGSASSRTDISASNSGSDIPGSSASNSGSDNPQGQDQQNTKGLKAKKSVRKSKHVGFGSEARVSTKSKTADWGNKGSTDSRVKTPPSTRLKVPDGSRKVRK